MERLKGPYDPSLLYSIYIKVRGCILFNRIHILLGWVVSTEMNSTLLAVGEGESYGDQPLPIMLYLHGVGAVLQPNFSPIQFTCACFKLQATGSWSPL